MGIKAINLRPGWGRLPLLKRWIPSVVRRWRQWRGQDWHLSQRGGILWLGCYSADGVDAPTLLRSGNVEDTQRHKLSALIVRTKADMFLDIGAFIGVYALTIRKQFPQLEVHAFEPHPMHYAMLAANALLNGWLDQMHLHPLGLGDKNEHTDILFKGPGASIALARNPEAFPKVFRQTAWQQEKCKVELRRLDSLLAVKGRVIAAKIDAEGFEQEVLRGMPNLLANNKMVLQIELWNPKQSIPKMEAFGLKYLGHVAGDDHYFANFPAGFLELFSRLTKFSVWC